MNKKLFLTLFIATLLVLPALALTTFVYPTPDNNTGVIDNFTINVTINEENLKEIIYGWDGTNYTYDFGINENLILLMNFDNETGYGETETHVVDFSGNGNNGTANGATLNDGTNCQFGGCYEFDGGDDIRIPNDPSLTPGHNITVSAWVNFNTLNARHTIVSKAQDFAGLAQYSISSYYLTFLDSSQKIYWDLFVCSTTGCRYTLSSLKTDWNTGQWYHVVGVYDGHYEKLYIDGELDNSVERPLGGEINSVSADLYVGRSSLNAKYNYHRMNGFIDEVVILNETLSETEVYQLYSSQLKNYPNENRSIATCYPQGYGGNSSMNITSPDNINWNVLINQSGIIMGETYEYFVSSKNTSNYLNSTEIRKVFGSSAPLFTFINTTPSLNELGSIDPLTNISFYFNITDPDDNLDTVILQWKNSTQEFGINNITMTNLTVKSIETSFNAYFTLPPYEDTITFRVWANDTVSSSIDSERNISSEYDCTWNISSNNLEETIGFFEDKNIGNFTIFNTGDSNYSGGCDLDFDLSYSGFGVDYWSSSNWYSNKRGIQMKDSSSIAAGENETFIINASFPSTNSPFTETPAITIVSDSNDTISGENTEIINSTLIISHPNPLLYQNIEEYPSSFVYLTPGSFNLSAYIRNMGGDGTDGNTAYNVSFNWTLNSDLRSRISLGDTSREYENLTNNSKQFLNLTINLTSENVISMPKGYLNATLYSYGYDNESDLIINSGNLTLLSEDISILFLCYGTPDGIKVTSCGSLDGDYVAPTVTTETPGGGGGSGSGIQTESLSSSEDLQLVRGKQNEIKINFTNKDENISIKKLTFKLSGPISKYTQIIPDNLNEVKPKEKIELTIRITSPTYIEIGRQELIVTIKGKKGANNYLETRKLILEIHELSGQEAKNLIIQSEELLKKLNESGLEWEYLSTLLNESKNTIENFNYEKVKENFEIIEENVNNAIKTIEIIENLDSLILKTNEKGIKTPDTSRLIKLSKLSIERKEFKTAYLRAKDAQLSYALETKGKLGRISYYLKMYPKEISGSALFLFIFIFGTCKISSLRKIKRKLKKLKKEEALINGLIKTLQEDTFKKKKMSMQEYGTTIEQYHNRISLIIQETIELETKRIHILKFSSKNKKLNNEKNKILQMIKILQKDYLQNQKIETKEYELKTKSYNSKLAEIDEKLALLEAKKMLRENSRKKLKIKKSKK